MKTDQFIAKVKHMQGLITTVDEHPESYKLLPPVKSL
jgi:hypothetical protein